MQSVINTDNTALYLDNTTGARTAEIYSYGNYYNWYSAYWSSTAYGDGAYTFSFSMGGGADPLGMSWRYNGMTMRCVADI